MKNNQVAGYHFPRWEELPGLALYMDQVLIVIDEAVGSVISHEEVATTPTMINNYVKIKLISPSQKKKYFREHLAKLIMITLLKRVFTMTELERILAFEDISVGYNQFCDELELRLSEAFSDSAEIKGTKCPEMLSVAVRTLAYKLRFEDLQGKE